MMNIITSTAMKNRPKSILMIPSLNGIDLFPDYTFNNPSTDHLMIIVNNSLLRDVIS